jgi:hypothetical protein
VRGKFDSHHIHSTGDPQPALSQIGLGNTQDLSLLFSMNRLRRRAKPDRASGLDLDKDQDLPILGNEINLTQRTGEVLLDDPKSDLL